MYSINTRLDGVSVFITEDRRKREEILFSELLTQEDCLCTINRLAETYNVPIKTFQECLTEGISYYEDGNPEILERFQTNADAFRKANYHRHYITHQKLLARLEQLFRRSRAANSIRPEASFTLVLQSR